ncbi:MAG: MgtC/SapB family protein [Prevotella sp.]|nr:MgtC/SapB family protein [Prevotella sp.]
MTVEFFLRIFVAAFLGGLIGLEREYRAKDAGFRTHFLVALGSSLFMILSQFGFDTSLSLDRTASLDPSRIASQVVTGIGFIGAGLIIFQKNVIRGLTTAAGLWVTSAIGLTCGAGLYVLAFATTALVLLCLETLNVILIRFGNKNMSITLASSSKENLKDVAALIKKECVELYAYNMEVKGHKDEKMFLVTMDLKVKRTVYDNWMNGILNEKADIEIVSIE